MREVIDQAFHLLPALPFRGLIETAPVVTTISRLANNGVVVVPFARSLARRLTAAAAS